MGRLRRTNGGFTTNTDDIEIESRYVVAATKNDVSFLEGVEGLEIIERGKTFVATDDRGRTDVDGLFAAGRLALQPYQTVVVAGHGASVGVAVVEDSDVPFYHDWVVPEGYFTGRDREVPPGCEEIDEEERRRREEDARAIMREYFAAPHPDTPVKHPSQR